AYLLAIHAAHAREHRQRLFGAAVQQHRRVVLLVDLGGLLYVELVDREAADLHSEDRVRMLLGLGAVLGELDPARLAAAAAEDLGLDHYRIAELRARL